MQQVPTWCKEGLVMYPSFVVIKTRVPMFMDGKYTTSLVNQSLVTRITMVVLMFFACYIVVPSSVHVSG
jgi:hypothetical protein